MPKNTPSPKIKRTFDTLVMAKSLLRDAGFRVEDATVRRYHKVRLADFTIKVSRRESSTSEYWLVIRGERFHGGSKVRFSDSKRKPYQYTPTSTLFLPAETPLEECARTVVHEVRRLFDVYEASLVEELARVLG